MEIIYLKRIDRIAEDSDIEEDPAQIRPQVKRNQKSLTESLSPIPKGHNVLCAVETENKDGKFYSRRLIKGLYIEDSIIDYNFGQFVDSVDHKTGKFTDAFMSTMNQFIKMYQETYPSNITDIYGAEWERIISFYTAWVPMSRINVFREVKGDVLRSRNRSVAEIAWNDILKSGNPAPYEEEA